MASTAKSLYELNSAYVFYSIKRIYHEPYIYVYVYTVQIYGTFILYTKPAYTVCSVHLESQEMLALMSKWWICMGWKERASERENKQHKEKMRDDSSSNDEIKMMHSKQCIYFVCTCAAHRVCNGHPNNCIALLLCCMRLILIDFHMAWMSVTWVWFWPVENVRIQHINACVV